MEANGILEPTEMDWEAGQVFFEERKLRRSDLGGAGDWTGWSDELDGVSSSFPLPELILTFIRRFTRDRTIIILPYICLIFSEYWALRH